MKSAAFLDPHELAILNAGHGRLCPADEARENMRRDGNLAMLPFRLDEHEPASELNGGRFLREVTTIHTRLLLTGPSKSASKAPTVIKLKPILNWVKFAVTEGAAA